ncbi:MAG: YcxB family protein [Xanthomonadaceae bacterium]|nr:YcxB family protein [Xanthomonadaceae bacterium]
MLATMLHYDRAIIRQAMHRFWWRTSGPMFLAMAALMMAFGLGSAVYYLGNHPWAIGAMAITLFFCVGCLAALTYIPFYSAMRGFIAKVPPEVQFTASETALSFISDAGVSEKPWSAVKELWQFPSCWLLLSSRHNFFILPVADLSLELQARIVERVRAARGRIR